MELKFKLPYEQVGKMNLTEICCLATGHQRPLPLPCWYLVAATYCALCARSVTFPIHDPFICVPS